MDNFEPPGGFLAYDALWQFGDQSRARTIQETPSATRRLEQILSGNLDRRDSFSVYLDRRLSEPQSAADLLIQDFYGRWQCGKIVAFGERGGGPLSDPPRREKIGALVKHLEITDWHRSTAAGRGREIFDLRFHLAENLERWRDGLTLLEAIELIDPISWDEFQALPDRKEEPDVDYDWFLDQVIRPSIARRDIILKRGSELAVPHPFPARDLAKSDWWARVDVAESVMVPADGNPVPVRVFAGLQDTEITIPQSNASRRPGLKVLVHRIFQGFSAERKDQLCNLRRKKTGAVGETAEQIHAELANQGFCFELSSVERLLREELTNWENQQSEKPTG